MNRDPATGLPDFIAALMAGLNSESQETNLNFSNPLWQMPMEMSFDENNFSAAIILGGERPEWLHDLDIIVFGRDNDEAMIAEDAEAEDWENELAFRVMDRNQNERLKALISAEETLMNLSDTVTGTEAADKDEDKDQLFIVIADAPNSQVGVLAVQAHCPSCVSQLLAVKGYMANTVLTLNEAVLMQNALGEAITAVKARNG